MREGEAVSKPADNLGWDLYHGHFFVHVREDTPQTAEPENPIPGVTGNTGDEGGTMETKAEGISDVSTNGSKEVSADDSTDVEEGKPGKNSQANIVCDFGILFHGKEFPKEYRASPFGPTFPIGSPGTEAEQREREGTCKSEGEKVNEEVTEERKEGGGRGRRKKDGGGEKRDGKEEGRRMERKRKRKTERVPLTLQK
jgi:hypothetical protein